MPYPNIQFFYYSPLSPITDSESLGESDESNLDDASSDAWSLSPPLPSHPTSVYTAGANTFTNQRNNCFLYQTTAISATEWAHICALSRNLPTESIVGQSARGNTFIQHPAGSFGDGERHQSFATVYKGWHQQPNEHITMHLGWTDEHGNKEVVYAHAHLHRNGLESVQELSGNMVLWVRPLGKKEYESHKAVAGKVMESSPAKRSRNWVDELAE